MQNATSFPTDLHLYIGNTLVTLEVCAINVVCSSVHSFILQTTLGPIIVIASFKSKNHLHRIFSLLISHNLFPVFSKQTKPPEYQDKNYVEDKGQTIAI